MVFDSTLRARRNARVPGRWEICDRFCWRRLSSQQWRQSHGGMGLICRAWMRGKSVRAGIRKLEGKHITLYTDLPAAREVDELPRVFDAAVPLWCDYFGDRAGESGRMEAGWLGDEGEGAVRGGGAVSGEPAGFSAWLQHGLADLGLRAAERLLPSAPAAARGDARLHESLARRGRAAVVHGGDGGAAGHAPLGRRQADAGHTCRERKEEVPYWGRVEDRQG